MDSGVNIKDLKTKFETLQQVIQSEKENSIRLESEINTLSTNYNEQLKVLLDMTGATTKEEALLIYKQKSAQLDSNKASLEEELNKYLDTYGEAPSEVI